MCAHNQLFMPAVAKAKEVIDSGALGQVYEVRTTDSFFNDFDRTRWAGAGRPRPRAAAS